MKVKIGIAAVIGSALLAACSVGNGPAVDRATWTQLHSTYPGISIQQVHTNDPSMVFVTADGIYCDVWLAEVNGQYLIADDRIGSSQACLEVHASR